MRSALAPGSTVNDLHQYDIAAIAWTDLSSATQGPVPSRRYGHGFVAAGGGIYLFGGCASDNPDEASLGECTVIYSPIFWTLICLSKACPQVRPKMISVLAAVS